MVKLLLPPSSCFAHDDLVAAGIHFEFFQRPRRWSTDVLAVEVVIAVVTSAPDMFCFGLILDDAVEVRADGGECFYFAGVGAHENSRLAPKLKDLSGIDRELVQLCGYDGALGRLDYLRRRHETKYRVDDCPEGRRGACA